MERLFNDVYTEATVHLSTHWSAEDGSYSSIHLNFYVPRWFLPQLVSEYGDRFAGSVQSCVNLLTRPLFGRETGERLELSTHLGGMVPLKYCLLRENNMPPVEVIHQLGAQFERFVRSFAPGPMRPTKEQQGHYFSSASIDYRCVCKSADARLELSLDIPATATQERFETFRANALAGLTLKQEKGRNHLRYDEDPSALGYGLFAVVGEIFGVTAWHKVIEELQTLFACAAADLNFSD